MRCSFHPRADLVTVASGCCVQRSLRTSHQQLQLHRKTGSALATPPLLALALGVDGFSRVGDALDSCTVFATNHSCAPPCGALQAREKDKTASCLGARSPVGGSHRGDVSAPVESFHAFLLVNSADCRRHPQRGMCVSRFIPSISSITEAKFTLQPSRNNECQSVTKSAHPYLRCVAPSIPEQS